MERSLIEKPVQRILVVKGEPDIAALIAFDAGGIPGRDHLGRGTGARGDPPGDPGPGHPGPHAPRAQR